MNCYRIYYQIGKMKRAVNCRFLDDLGLKLLLKESTGGDKYVFTQWCQLSAIY